MSEWGGHGCLPAMVSFSGRVPAALEEPVPGPALQQPIQPVQAEKTSTKRGSCQFTISPLTITLRSTHRRDGRYSALATIRFGVCQLNLAIARNSRTKISLPTTARWAQVSSSLTWR